MTDTPSYVTELEREARECERAENEFRRTMNDRVAELARERAFAYRRMNVMRSLFETVERAESREIAVASAIAALRQRLGWVEDTPARDEVLGEYAKLAGAAFAETHPDAASPDGEPEGEGQVVLASATAGEEAPADTRAALAAFESWYASTREKPFWVLFEHYMPETQLVDF